MTLGKKNYREAARRGMSWLAGQLQTDGTYGQEASDLVAYYKSPYLYVTGGRGDLGYRVLDHIRRSYLRKDGNLRTTPEVKTADPVLAQYEPYMNAWVVMGAQKLGRFDVAQPVWDFVDDFFHPTWGGFTMHAAYGRGDDVTEAIVTALLGLSSLYVGDLDRARKAGSFLLRLIELQPDLEHGFYLRLDEKRDLITEFAEEEAPLYVVRADHPQQLYFFVGGPMGFLARLAEATSDQAYLDGARAYLTFLQSVDESLYTFSFSHKVAWGASVLARVGDDPAAREMAIRVANFLVDIQDASGGWLMDQPLVTSLDQSAEIATWLFEIDAELG